MPRHRGRPPEFITRVDSHRAHGWWVRITRSGQRVSKLFSDTVFGGKAKARRQAVAFRDRQLEELPSPAHGRQMKPGTGRVYREIRSYRDRKTGELVYYPAWSAWIRVKVACHTGYSIPKHGELGAKKKAEAWLNKNRRWQKLWLRASGSS